MIKEKNLLPTPGEQARKHFETAQEKMASALRGMPKIEGMQKEKSRLDQLDEEIRRTLALRNFASAKKDDGAIKALDTQLRDLREEQAELIRKGEF